MILLKPVFIIAIVVVVMIGMMVPNIFAQYYDAYVLDPFPITANEGDLIMFSGILLSPDGTYGISNEVVSIKNDIPNSRDSSIAFATTDENDEFVTSWIVVLLIMSLAFWRNPLKIVWIWYEYGVNIEQTMPRSQGIVKKVSYDDGPLMTLSDEERKAKKKSFRI